MCLTSMFICYVCGVYLVDDLLYIIIWYARGIILLNCTPETAPVHDYMVWRSNLQVCSVRKYYDWDYLEISDFGHEPFNRPCVCLILANWISELVLFTRPTPKSLLPQKALLPFFRVLMAENPTFIALCFYNENAIRGNYNMVYLGGAILGW